MRQCPTIIKFIFIVVFCSFLSCLAIAADSFLSGTEDVPVMNGIDISEDETFSFDNEDGRLFFSKGFTAADPESVLSFYQRTLPQLGWQEKEVGTFVRENDTLQIGTASAEFHHQDLTTVIFELIIKSK